VQNTSPPFWRTQASSVVVTSVLYPLEIIEELQVNGLGFQSIAGALREWPKDLLDVSFAVLGGTLASPLVTINTAPESLDVALALTSATLVTPIIYITLIPEALDVTFNFRPGSALDVILVQHTQPAESLDITFNLLSGTLV
jgi:hypothetical protein